MDRNKEIIIGVAVVVIIVAGYFIVAGLGTKAGLPTGENQNASNTPQASATGTIATVTLPGAPAAAAGASIVASSGIVVAPAGTPAKNNVAPGSPTAPQQSNPITSSAAIPSNALKLTVSVANGFAPNAFTVTAGSAVTLTITSADQFTHIFAFEDPSLSAVVVGVGPGETRAITFNVPTKVGAYKYFSNIPGQYDEAGVMTVK